MAHPRKNKVFPGEQYGRGTVIREYSKMDGVGKKCPQIKWFVDLVCDCGNEYTVRIRDVTTGGTKSCGCLRREHLIAINKSRIGTGKPKPESVTKEPKKSKPKKESRYLSPAKVRQIRALSKHGMTRKQIADYVGIHPLTVGNIINGKTYKHVD